MFELDMQKKIK